MRYEQLIASYTVRHLQEKVSGTGDDLKETEILSGAPGDPTQAKARKYPGFIEYPIDQVEIAADGSTAVDVRYWRVSYSISFVTSTDGSYVKPISKKFGAPIAASELPDPTTVQRAG